MIGKITHYFRASDMIRWTLTGPAPPPQRWQPREEILKAHLDSLSPDELRRLRPGYYWLRFGQAAWIRNHARKANFNPNQPRVPAGNPDGGQWTSEGSGINDRGVISDATPDNNWKPGAQFAAGPRGPRDRLPPLPHTPGFGEPRTYRPGQLSIVNNAQTGFSTIDDTTEQLRNTLEKVVNARGEGYGPDYGKAIHYDFGDAVKSQNLRGVRVEHTFPERDAWYGKPGTIRTDVVLRNEIGEVIAIYDVKTGGAYLDARRVAELRAKTGVGLSVPLIEMHIQRGLSLKSRAARTRYFWFITLRLWNPWYEMVADQRAGAIGF
jgi:hypothetical protein